MNWIIIASTNEVLRDLKTMPKLIFTSFQNNSMKGNPDKSFTYCQWKVSKYGVNSGPHFPVFGLNTEIYGVISSPYFPVFGLNTEIYSVNLRIQSEYRKIRTRNNSVIGNFLRLVYKNGLTHKILQHKYLQNIFLFRSSICKSPFHNMII